jgi:diguanylate cyclase (GGDEF)-like protein
MSSTIRAYLLILLALLAVTGAVFTASHAQRTTADTSFQRTEATNGVLTAQLVMDSALHSYLESGGATDLDAFGRAQREFDLEMIRAHVAAGDNGEQQGLLEDQELISEDWQAIAERQIFARQNPAADGVSDEEDAPLLTRFRASNDELREVVSAEREAGLARAERLSITLIVLVAVGCGALGYWTVVRYSRQRRRRAENARKFRGLQDEFTETLQVMRDEREAQRLVRHHLERSIDSSSVVVMNRNNSDNRLEAATEIPETSVLSGRLIDANPESCLAVRLTHEHDEREGADSLMTCELCGKSANSTCVPSLVGGEVIGSVLVSTEEPLEDDARERVRQTVNQAAPVLANLRSLAIAESRASTDELTGLPNKRACDDNLRRMVAHAARTITPLAAVLFDLDRFKQINDRFGHGVGDDALAAVGAAVAGRIRTSDFAGRYGGEEFLLLLPDTDAEGAQRLAEEIRVSIAALHIPKLDRRMTASFGVSIHPDHALDADTLVRVADRALYAAKGAGRNQVCMADASDAADAAEAAEAQGAAQNGKPDDKKGAAQNGKPDVAEGAGQNGKPNVAEQRAER